MMYTRVIKSFVIGLFFVVHALFAHFQCFSYQHKPQRLSHHISIQPYHRKISAKSQNCKKPQLLTKPIICLATDNKQQLYELLQIFNQQFVKAQLRHNHEFEARYVARIKALKATIETGGAVKDYLAQVPHDFVVHSDHQNLVLIGTELDRCLYDQLYTTQQAAFKVLNADKSNMYAQHLVPLIIDTTIQATQEQDSAVAFANADVAAQLTKIIEQTSTVFTAVGSGVQKSLHSMVSLEHWKQMAIGLKNLATSVIVNAAEQELLEDAHYCYDKNVSKELLQLYNYKTEQQKRALHEHFAGTCRKLQAMSQSEFVEFGVEFATTLLLDTVMLNAVGWVTTAAGRATIETVERVFAAGVAERYTAELMDLGRLVVTKDEHSLIKGLNNIEKNSEKYLSKEVSFIKILKEEIEYKSPIILNKASTGRIIPRTLEEQLAFKEVLADPLVGAQELTSVVMTDPRWHYSEGWIKMAKNVNGVEIHYLYNKKSNVFDDFKFKKE